MSRIDYHCPQAMRVIDFAHAQSYVAPVGKAVYGQDTETFRRWFAASLNPMLSLRNLLCN